MEFASELVIEATLLGLRITEVPTTLDKAGRGRVPHLRPWRDGWRNLRLMLLHCPRWLFLYPGAVLLLAGTVAGLCLLVTELVLARRVEFELQTLLAASVAAVLGFQSVAFAQCSRNHAPAGRFLPEDKTLDRIFGRWTLEREGPAGHCSWLPAASPRCAPQRVGRPLEALRWESEGSSSWPFRPPHCCAWEDRWSSRAFFSASSACNAGRVVRGGELVPDQRA